MNLTDYDRSFVRQRNEEMMREVHEHRLQRRSRTSREDGEGVLHEGKGVLRARYVVLIVAVLAVMASSLTFSGRAFASHEHYLVTPGTCVGDIASGQTENGPGEGGYHKFHENVHLGTPGMMAFENENNPVAVYKTGTGPGCPTG